MKKITYYGIMGFAIFLIAGFLFNSGTSTTDTAKTEILWTEEKQNFIESFLQAGNEIEVENKRAYVIPEFWNRIDHKGKEDVSCVIAQYCEHKNKDNLTFVNIHDKMSGKKLAKWSNTYGYTTND